MKRRRCAAGRRCSSHWPGSNEARGNLVLQRANATPNVDALFGFKRASGKTR